MHKHFASVWFMSFVHSKSFSLHSSRSSRMLRGAELPLHTSALRGTALHPRKSCRRNVKHSFRSSHRPPRRSVGTSALDSKSQTDLTNKNSSSEDRGPVTDDEKRTAKTSMASSSSSEGELQLLPNRRFFLAGLGSLSIGLLLGTDGGQLAGKLKVDALFPVRGLKRCINYEQRFEFQYPGDWLADQNMYKRRAQRIERSNGLDPAAPTRQRRTVAEPEAAFGPPGSTGEENISVVVAPIQPGFKLESLGTAEQAGRRFLDTTVASINANREAELLAAESRHDETGQLYYNLEYTVKSPQFFRHNVSVYAARDGILYTFNAQCPEGKWTKEKDKLTVAAKSFALLH